MRLAMCCFLLLKMGQNRVTVEAIMPMARKEKERSLVKPFVLLSVTL